MTGEIERVKTTLYVLKALGIVLWEQVSLLLLV